MEIAKGNFLCSYLYLKQAKMSLFFILSSLFSSMYRKAKQILPRGEDWQQWEGEETGKVVGS
jgi:hypothetical protein